MKTTCAAALALLLVAPPLLADKKVDDAVAKADELAQKGKTDEAIKTLQKTCDSTPGPECLTALARLQYRLGMLDDAAATGEKLVASMGSAPPQQKAHVLALLARLDLRRGTGKDALAHAEEAVKADPNSFSLAVLAQAYARAGNGARALETADKAVAAGSTPDALEARGEALLMLRKFDDAAGAFRKAIEADPKMTAAHIGLVTALVQAGKAAEAVAEAKKTSDADPKYAEAFAALGEAVLAENPKNWNDAIAQAQQAAFLNPRSPLIQVTVAKMFEAAGNLDQAQAAYKKALEVDPGYVPAQSAMIDVQIRRGDLDGALSAAMKLANDNPANAEAQLRLGEVLLRKKDYENARPALEKAVAGLAGSADAHYYLGQADQFTNRMPEAVRAYQKAVELAPNNPDYRSTYGLALGLVGREEDGVVELKKVVATPGYKGVAGWANLGWVYRNMDPPKTTESIEAYKKAAEIDPKNPQIPLGLGWAYSYTREWDQSIAAFQKAIDLDPTLAGEAYNGMAWCYFFKRDMPQAKAFADKAEAKGRSVKLLKTNIDKVEKAVAAGQKAAADAALAAAQVKQQEGPDLGAARNVLIGKNPAAKRKVCGDLRAAGAEGAEMLGFGLNDEDLSVREACAASLAALGCRGAAAGPSVQRVIAAGPPAIDLNASKDAMLLEARWGDFLRTCKEIAAKLGSCH